MKWNRRDWFFLFAVTLLGAALRLYKLGVVPPGFQFDEAFNAIDADQVLAGNWPLFLPANAGREVIYTYWQASIAWLAGGITPVTLRLASALAGTIAVPLAYLLVRRLLRQQSRSIALFTSLTLALSLWNIHFSHFGIRVIMMPMLLSVAFGAYWLAAEELRPGRRAILFGVSGAVVGLSVWTHPTGRLVPIVLMGYTLWQILQMPASQRFARTGWFSHPVSGLLITGAVAFVVFLPLGLEFYRRPDFFLEHAAEAFVFNDQVGGDSPWLAIGHHTLQVLGMFNLSGDVDWTHNLPGRPVFDPLMSIPFLIGLFIWLRRICSANDPDRNALVLCGLWVLVMLFPSILSNDAPDYSRTLPTHPALFLTTGLGLTWLSGLRSKIGHPRAARWVGAMSAAGVVAVSGVWTFYDYFVLFPQHTEVYYMYDVDKQDALHYLQSLTDDHQVYLSQLWGGHASVTFLRGQYGIQSFDSSDTLVLPMPAQGAVYAFPAEQQERADKLASELGVGTLESTTDPHGKPLLWVVQTSAGELNGWPGDLAPQQQTEAYFEEAPTLLGLSATRFGQPSTGALTLYWRAENSTLRDLTSFVHLIDADGNRVGQVDKTPGNGSYRTPFWRPGERVLDVYYPHVDEPCASGETVRAVVGWYELAANGLRRPRLETFGDTALAGEVQLPIRAYPRAEMSPAVVSDIQTPTGAKEMLHLWGYTLHDTDLQAGSPLQMDIFWQKNPNLDDKTANLKSEASVSLRGDAEEVTLWSGAVHQPESWTADEVICQRLRVRVPAEIAAGQYSLSLAMQDAENAQAEADLGQITLEPSTRSYALPSPITPADALWGAIVGQPEIALAGTQIGEQSLTAQTLEVTLVWQAQTAPLGNYTAFLHLIDAQGQIVSQSDAQPADEYATNQWAPGEVILDTHLLTLPEELDAGPYRLRAGLYDALNGQRLWGADHMGQSLPDSAAEFAQFDFKANPEK